MVIVVTAVTLLLIAGRMFFKMLSLRQGGAAVAASLGAVPVDPTTTDPQLRRFLNIVEEMSLASGVPTPRLFVMPREPGINAFAAGFTPADAAITVTGGALAQLNRDELQGVIGHEFSHILNGDMRLNIRLIGLLAGILLVGMIGLRFLQFGGRGSDSKGAAPIVALAAAMMVLGFIGVFFANLIKASVSRQREWLADASAVQFTRQTTGLEGALKKIAGIPTGSRLRDSRSASEVSHMLFGEGARRSFASLFATHPQLTDRIKTLNPSFDPREIAELKQRYAQRAPDGLEEDIVAGFAPAGTALGRPAAGPGTSIRHVRQTCGQPRASRRPRRHVHPGRPEIRCRPACAVACRRAPARDPAEHGTGRRNRPTPCAAPARRCSLANLPRWLSDWGLHRHEKPQRLADRMARLPHDLRLPFVELALPQLAVHSRDYQDALVAALNELAVADGTVSMFEYCVTRLVWSYLLDAADPSRRSKAGNGSLSQVRPLVTTLLATLAVAGGGDQDTLTARVRYRTPPRIRRCGRGRQPAPAVLAADARRWLGRAGRLGPRAKQALVEAMVEAVLDDGTVTAPEAELLRAACGLMHVPLPALLA